MDGALIEEPGDPGLAGLWLRSAGVRSVVEDVARAAGEHLSPSVHAAAPGLWLIPVPLWRRRRRIGMVIAAAIGPAIDGAPLVESACHQASLDPVATRGVLRQAACFDEASARRLASTLEWMAGDLGSLVEQESAVQGFAAELSQTYETVDTLYALGRSMKDLHDPDGFFALLFDRLHGTLPFGWVAAQFGGDEKALGALAGRSAVRGTPPWTPQEGLELGRRFTERLVAEPRTLIASVADGGDGGEARVLAQPVVLGGRVVGVLFAGDRQAEDPQVSSYDIQLIEAAAAFLGAFLENARLYRDQQAMFMGSLKALTAAIDAKDRYTCGHSERVAYLGAQLARAVGLDESTAQRVHLSGLLHDVGKIGVPEAVLRKPGRLTDEEFAEVRKHPQIGYDILKDIPMLEDILPGVLHHHERFDGKGYPHGLAGEDIPLFARILGLVDTFDAMSSTRAYRAGMPREKVMAELERCAGAQFDPRMAAAFRTLDLSAYDAMVERHAAMITPQPPAPAVRAAA